MDLNGFLNSLIGLLNISSLNSGVFLAILVITLIGEVNIAVPLLLESIWLLVGYQSRMDTMSMRNAGLLFLTAQAGRQASLIGIYNLFPFINKPLSKLYMKPLQSNRLYKKFAGSELHEFRFLTPLSATLGMMTPLNGPIKFILIFKRKLRPLLIGALFSGMVFDVFYLVIGAVFGTTTLNLAFMPLFLVVGFVGFIVIRLKILR